MKSLRFESFLTLLKNSDFIIGNSSSAIYEAPMFNVPSINIGDRQHKRLKLSTIKNYEIKDLDKYEVIKFLKSYKKTKKNIFGKGNSDKKFIDILTKKSSKKTTWIYCIMFHLSKYKYTLLDKTEKSFVFEVSALKKEIDELIKKLQPLGLASASRTGVVAMTKGSEIYKQS